MIFLLLFLDLTGVAHMKGDAIEATCTGTWLGKPPLAIHSFDVKLKNPSPQPRWLLLPRNFGEPFPGTGASVSIYKLSERVMAVQAANFQTVKLPGHGSITLRDVKIESWTRPEKIDLEVVVARTIKQLEHFVKESASGQEVKAPEGAADKRMQKGPKWDQAPEVVVDVEMRAVLVVPIKY
jgi:hypothetical protein